MKKTCKILLTAYPTTGKQNEIVRWRNFEVHFFPFLIEELSGRRGVDSKKMRVDREKLDHFLELMEDFDVVWSETPEALLVQYVRKKRGLRTIPFVISEVDLLQRARTVAEWIKQVYGESPLESFLSNKLNFWINTTSSHEDFYLEQGIPVENLFFIPSSVFQMGAFFPDVGGLFHDKESEQPTDETEGILKELKGKILCPGINRRDFFTLHGAVGLCEAEVHVITDTSMRRKISSPYIHYVDVQPLGHYVRAIRNSKFILVPLFNTRLSGGQQTPVIAMRYGKAVVASDVDATRDYIEDGVTGLLVEPENPEALARAIKRLDRDSKLRRELGKAARKKEEEISRVAESRYITMLDRAFEAAGGGK